MIRKPFALLTMLFLAMVIVGCQQAPPPTPVDLVIRNVTLIDSASGVRGNRSVLVDDGQIVGVVAAGDTHVSARSTLDGTGKFLIPGLWDMHVHITYEPDLSAAMPQLFLSYGITSVRDTGGLLDKLNAQLPLWRSEGAIAPRLFFSGPLLDGAKVVYDGTGRPEIGISNASPAAARASIARLKSAGVDFVKIYELVDPAVFAALVDAAREAELPIASHVPLAVGAAVAGPKVDSMEHLRNVELACAEEAAAELMDRRQTVATADAISGYDLRRSLHAQYHDAARNNISDANCEAIIAGLANTIQVPTLRLNTFARYPAFERPDWLAHVARLPEPARQRWVALAENWKTQRPLLSTSTADWSLSLVPRLRSAGVPIGAGTDTPIGSALPGYSLHTELERLVDAGLTPAEALQSATVIPARFFGLQDRMGNIATGQAADLVLLDANPLNDIRHTRRIAQVVSRGRIVDLGQP